MRLAVIKGVGLIGLGGTVAPANYTPVPGYSQTQIVQLVTQAAQQYNVPVNLALGIASHESGFTNNATNLNTNGTYDYGVMQLNSTTVQTLGVSNPYDPTQNIDAGVQLLGSYLQQYGGNSALALQAYATGNANGAPSTATQSFIDSVTSYDPTAALASAGIDPSTVTDTTDLADDGTDIVDDSTTASVDWTTIGLIAAAAILAVAII